MRRLELIHSSQVDPTHWPVVVSTIAGGKVGLRGKTPDWVSLIPVERMAIRTATGRKLAEESSRVFCLGSRYRGHRHGRRAPRSSKQTCPSSAIILSSPSRGRDNLVQLVEAAGEAAVEHRHGLSGGVATPEGGRGSGWRGGSVAKEWIAWV